MTDKQLTELLRHAYQWGRDNGSNRSEKNFNDFLETEIVQKALSTSNVLGQSRSRHCRHPEDKIWYNEKSQMQCNNCGEEL